MFRKRLWSCIALTTILLFSSDGCSKMPVEKKVEPSVLRPVVAGQFYPAERTVLSAMIDKYLKDAAPESIDGHIIGLVAPHAGYQYSGAVAANAFKLVEGKSYSTVVVMAPSHRVGFEGIALTTKDFYETPLGKIPIAKEFSEKLISELTWAKDDPRPFAVEHSLEVELPFLQTVLKDFRLLPVIIGICDEKMLSLLASRLNDMLPGDDVLFVASTDLSHFDPYDTAVAKDARTLKLVERMDLKALTDAEKKGGADMCGSAPVRALMEIAKLRGAKAQIVKYANSGDTAGDKTRVVGYGAVAFVGGSKEKVSEGGLSVEQKRALIKLARGSVEAHVLKRPLPSVDLKDPVLAKNGAAFVTIRKKGELRGCIGHIIAIEPLARSVRDNAVAASSDDPRFPPVAPDELKDIDIEISVLTEPEPLPNPMDVRVGTDGLIIQRGFNRGVLLPQVPQEQGWNKEQFLEGICRKAGMERNCWKNANLNRFQAIVFHE